LASIAGSSEPSIAARPPTPISIRWSQSAGANPMDKKEKKRLEVLQQKIAKLQHLLAGAKKQPDDPAEVPRLEKELATAHAELAALKKG
jgi:hypothetical protein